jgi:hypothetical protein
MKEMHRRELYTSTSTAEVVYVQIHGRENSNDKPDLNILNKCSIVWKMVPILKLSANNASIFTA